jgi:hypothetical protein
MQEEYEFIEDCPFGGDLCMICTGHAEGDENGIGYCIDCSACWSCEQQRVIGEDGKLTCVGCLLQEEQERETKRIKT